MSVFRQPEVLGQTTRKRVMSVTGAVAAGVFEAVGVGLWFLLVVETDSHLFALLGLGLLFVGSLLRAGLYGVTTKRIGKLLAPDKLATAVILTAGWVLWLTVGTAIDGTVGIFVAACLLVALLTVQFAVERHVFDRQSESAIPLHTVVPGLILATGATVLFVTAFAIDWSITTPLIELAVTSVVLRVEAIQVGFIVFLIFALLAHHHRLEHIVDL